MSKKKTFLLLVVMGFITLNSYLFVTAPAPLGALANEERKTFSVNDGFRIVSRLNDAYRTLYTRKIVGDGQKAGLQFDENWRNHDIEAGPLPALFLRTTSSFLEKSSVPLGLYLGSDKPISRSNLFTGIQKEKFEAIRQDAQPRFFYDEGSDRYIAMFPDFASAEACVSCHNNHENSPKKDWKLHDIMGATTWSYPADSLTTGEMLNWLEAYIWSAEGAYSAYLDKSRTFHRFKQPQIGEQWPMEGYFLPSAKTFSDSVLNKVAVYMIDNILNINELE